MSEIFSPQNISVVVLILLALSVRIVLAVGKTKISAADQDRLEKVAAQAVAAAEEMGKREAWTSAQKLAYSQELIKQAFPKLNTSYVDMAIHAALALIQIGNAGATATSK